MGGMGVEKQKREEGCPRFLFSMDGEFDFASGGTSGATLTMRFGEGIVVNSEQRCSSVFRSDWKRKVNLLSFKTGNEFSWSWPTHYDITEDDKLRSGKGFGEDVGPVDFSIDLRTSGHPFLIWSQKWCRLRLRCLVHGQYLSPSLARVRAPWLSAKMTELPRPFLRSEWLESNGGLKTQHSSSKVRRKELRLGRTC